MDLPGMLLDAVWEYGSDALDVVAGGIGWLFGMVADFIVFLSAALPDGNLAELPEALNNWDTGLMWLNWWLPIDQLAAVMAAWVAATLVYFVYQFKLRLMVFGGK